MAQVRARRLDALEHDIKFGGENCVLGTFLQQETGTDMSWRVTGRTHIRLRTGVTNRFLLHIHEELDAGIRKTMGLKIYLKYNCRNVVLHARTNDKWGKPSPNS